MDCRELIKKHLQDNGYDGLFNSEVPCGCGIDDLFPCDSSIEDCEPAYKWITNCKDCESHCDAYDGIDEKTICFRLENPTHRPVGEE